MTISNALDTPTGLFLARFEIGGEMPGAPLFTVSFAVYTPQQTLTGMGRLTQAVNPPLDLASKLDGDYTYMTVMPDLTHILVTAVGHPVLDAPVGTGVPSVPPNVALRMVLDADWQRGTANYRYAVDGGEREVTNAPVRQLG